MDDSRDLSILETLKNSDLNSVSEDFAEIAIDSLLKDGFLKDIPVINTILSIYKTGISVKDLLFMRKILYFLNGMNEISLEDRMKMLGKLEKDNKRFGEMIILCLERMDDMEKPRLFAKAFSLLAKGSINTKDFFALKNVIENVNLSDIEEIVKFYNNYFVCPIELTSYLMHSKLASFNEAGVMDPAHPLFRPTKIGELFLTDILEIKLKKGNF